MLENTQSKILVKGTENPGLGKLSYLYMGGWERSRVELSSKSGLLHSLESKLSENSWSEGRVTEGMH